MSKKIGTAEAAELAGVSLATINRAARSGAIACCGGQRSRLFEESDVLAFAAERAKRPERRGRRRPAETHMMAGAYVPKTVHDWIVRRAEEQGVTANRFINDILMREYEKEVLENG